jgi:hypothetical protein
MLCLLRLADLISGLLAGQVVAWTAGFLGRYFRTGFFESIEIPT